MTVKKSPKKKNGSTELTTVADAREFKKANQAIGLRVTEGNLSLLSRKVFNVMIYYAQEMREPGKNAPIKTATSNQYYWIPLSELAKNAAYESKDTQTFKAILTGLLDIKLLLETEKQWTSERLVSSVTLVNSSGLNRKEGQVWFGYSFPPEVHEYVIAPSTYTRLSLVYQSSLKSGSALALYEICRRFATNPSKLTFIQSVEYWYGAITGKPYVDNEPPEYKYFKRDVLKTAIAELNTLTDISVELIEHKVGKQVKQLQFKVEFNKQKLIDFPASPIIDSELIEKIMMFGLSKASACDLIAEYDEDHIRVAVSRVESRQQAQNMTALGSPAAYFRWTLRDLEKNPLKSKAIEKKTTKKKTETIGVMDKFKAARNADALIYYNELSPQEQASVMDDFKVANEEHSKYFDRGLESGILRAFFCEWYAHVLWGDPTAEAVALFIESGALSRN